jgi:hypothetical protein
MPGVDNVSIVSGLPPQRQANGFGTDVEDYTPRRDVLDVVDYYQTVTAGYFEAMRVPIVRGRAFREADRIGAPWRWSTRRLRAPSGRTSTRSADV